MSTRRSNLLSKKVIIVVAILAIGSISVILIASSIAQATTAQQQGQQKMMREMMRWSGEEISQINGSVSVANEASNLINETVRVPFVSAAETAQGQVTNGTVFGGHLGVVQEYLVYTFFVVANTANQTGHLTVIDVGNGEVLYTSEGQPLGSFGHSSMYGHFGGHGHGGGWDRPWKGQDWG
jgi:hypothetical protein